MLSVHALDRSTQEAQAGGFSVNKASVPRLYSKFQASEGYK